jgi:exodeoxyribonuclease V gamma subunit
MLESLLSARRVLYVSWCGHSVRDNSAQAPSVLVSQLRD